MLRDRRRSGRRKAAGADERPRTPTAWLLLVHHLPPRPSHIRVKTWRRLHQVGAVSLKSSVYVLPNTDQAREDFEWIRGEIAALGGQASVFAGATVADLDHDELVRLFRTSRQADYQRLRDEAEGAARRAAGRVVTAARRGRLQRAAGALRAQLERVEAIDFFGAPGRAAAASAIASLERRADEPAPPAARQAPAAPLQPAAFRRRLWVTRPRPGVDRMGSAWFVRRFVDPRARFGFATAADRLPSNRIPFDMFGVEFGHHGDRCTLETLLDRFAIRDPAAVRVAQIVHDLDLKDDRFALPECPGVAAAIEGLQHRYADDHELLERGLVLFEALYRAFSARAAASTPVRRAAGRRSRRRTS